MRQYLRNQHKKIKKSLFYLLLIGLLTSISHAEIIDNTDFGFSTVGNWPTSKNSPGYYGTDYQYSRADDGSKSATWSIEIDAPGQYEVSARWTAHPNRVTNATYNIYNNGVLLDSAIVNQRIDGSQFNPLNTYTLSPGTLEVVLTNAGIGYVIADAVQIDFLGGLEEVAMDNSDPGFATVGNWPNSISAPGYFGSDYQYAPRGDGSMSATWSFDIGFQGLFEISAQWSPHVNRAPDAPFSIYNNGQLLDTVIKDQRVSGGFFNPLNTYNLNPGSLEVVLTNAASGYVIADAVQITFLSQSQNLAPDGVIITPSDNIEINVGGTVDFSGTGTDPDNDLPLIYTWSFGDPDISDRHVENPGPVQFDTAGIFIVTLTVTDAEGLADPTPAQIVVSVLENVAPDGVIDTPTGNIEVNVSDWVNFSGTGSDPDDDLPLTYTWSFGDPNIPVANVESPGLVQFNTVGNFLITFTVTDVEGLADPTPAQLVVNVSAFENSAPDGVIDSPSGNIEVIVGDWVDFSGTGNDPDNHLPLSYTWSFGDPNIPVANVESPGLVQFNTVGSFVVAFTVTDAEGLADPTPEQIVVNVSASENLAPDGVIDSPFGNIEINIGDSVNFSGAGSDPDNDLPLTYAWSFGDPVIPDAIVENPGLVQFNTVGSFVVTFTVTDAEGLADPTPAQVMVNVLQENPSEHEDGFALMSEEVSLDGQSNWNYYDGGDAPEGAYMGWVRENQTYLEGTIDLGQTLQPGNYYVALKVLEYKKGTIEISMGGGSAAFQPNRRDFNGQWNLPVSVEVSSATNNLVIRLLKTIAVDKNQKYLIRGIYVTSNPNEIVDRNDIIINLTYPTERDNSAPVKGNIIENSSYEVGTGHGWGLLDLDPVRDFSIKSLRDTTEFVHGNASLKVPPGRQLISKVIRVKPNKKYTLSAWFKSSIPTEVRFSIKSVFKSLAGYQPTVTLFEEFTTTTDWQRISVTGYLLKYPTNDYQINVHMFGEPGNNVWIDAVQLEEGDLTEYSTKRPLEIGLIGADPNNIFFEDEQVSMTLLAYNNNTSAVSSLIHYEIYDNMNNIVKTDSVSIIVSPQSTLEQDLDLATGKRGIFRIVLWVDNVDGTLEEVVYSVIPRPYNMGLDENSIMGIHGSYAEYLFGALQKMGIKWTRAVSPGAFFRWSKVEPTEGNFIWYDDEIQKALVHGVNVLGVIGSNDYWPEWADAGGQPDLDKWENFVYEIVNHYKNDIKYWEIWNEAYNQFTPEEFAELQIRATNAIRTADPSAKIIGMGGTFYLWWIEDVIDFLGPNWTSYMDSISTHIYPRNSAANKRYKDNIIDPYGMPVWNTEAGAWDSGFYKGSNSNFISLGRSIWAHKDSALYHQGSLDAAERLTTGFLSSIGEGLSRYFYYDARLFVNPNYFKDHPSIIAYDDTIRVKGIAYSILAYLFDHSQGLGDIMDETSADPDTQAYLFDRNGTPLVGLWSNDQTNKAIRLNIPGAQYKVYDMMGNTLAISNSTIPYNRTPVYVEGEGISVDDLRAAFEAGEISERTDTEPPKLSISSAPIGSIRENPLRVRWIAIDETSSPDDLNPDAVLYSYRLEGFDDNWSEWSAATYIDYTSLLSGSYVFSVKAKDTAGNISPTVSREIIIEP
jgi:hypothetical protein